MDGIVSRSVGIVQKSSFPSGLEAFLLVDRRKQVAAHGVRSAVVLKLSCNDAWTNLIRLSGTHNGPFRRERGMLVHCHPKLNT